MSESVSNNSESYSTNNKKYSGESVRRSYESHYDSPARNNNSLSKNQENLQKLENLKSVLLNTEKFLVEFTKNQLYSIDSNIIKQTFRDMILNNEEEIKKFPDLNAIVEFYNRAYIRLSQNNEVSTADRIIFEGLNELQKKQKIEKSVLKYW